MNDDFNMEDELANSIAQIIDEETPPDPGW